jgi:Endonuclease/Exonuclease/phosphatase family
MRSMLKWLLLFCLFPLYSSSFAQQKNTVVFYNTENLFDTWDDPLTADEEFTPHGSKHWSPDRLSKKLKMLYKAIIAASEGQFPSIIGLAEVENRWVVEQLINQTPLRTYPYGIIHKDSPDPRGIDVALIYRKDRIKVVDFDFIPVGKIGNNGFQSRDILYLKAKLYDKQLHIFVNHWSSRSGGYTETIGKRDIAATILRSQINALQWSDPNARIIIMGDFNAGPTEKCIAAILKAIPYPGNDDLNSLVNLSTLWSNLADGTIRNGGQWEVFDQIICSRNLLSDPSIQIKASVKGICNFIFLLEPDKTYLGFKPFRTYMGPTYHGGTSDHLPIKIQILSTP